MLSRWKQSMRFHDSSSLETRTWRGNRRTEEAIRQRCRWKRTIHALPYPQRLCVAKGGRGRGEKRIMRCELAWFGVRRSWLSSGLDLSQSNCSVEFSSSEAHSLRTSQKGLAQMQAAINHSLLPCDYKVNTPPSHPRDFLPSRYFPQHSPHQSSWNRFQLSNFSQYSITSIHSYIYFTVQSNQPFKMPPKTAAPKKTADHVSYQGNSSFHIFNNNTTSRNNSAYISWIASC